MSGILRAMSCRLGLYVEKNAQATLTEKMKKNSRHGKTNGVGMLMNMERWKDIDQPTIVPIRTPLKELAATRMNASYVYNLVITLRVKPIARITEISLQASNRFPVIDELSEKKQMNIVIAITTWKMASRVFSA